MNKNTSQTKNKSYIKHLRTLLIIGFTFIVAFAITSVSFIAIKKTDLVMKSKVTSMTSSLNVQMRLNMSGYLSRMETIATLAFGLREAYKYDATDPDNDEYTAINTEKLISDNMYNLCIMENFVDYGIIYKNNHFVGKISNGTVGLFGDKMYSELEGMIVNSRTNDGWNTGYNDDFKRIYYVKRVHENAILVISFYATELESVFDNPETLSDMEIRLVNGNQKIIYSAKREEVGKQLPYEISSRISDKTSATVMDDSYLVSINECGYDWYVICSIPTQIILKEKNDIKYSMIAVGCIGALLTSLVAAWFCIRVSYTIDSKFRYLDSKAHIDQLTGVLNKRAFEEYTEGQISGSPKKEKHALILLDLDNFKGVNDTLGHAYGDQVLTKTGSILRGIFSSEDLLGRIGGDEFSVFVNSSRFENDAYVEFVKAKCAELCEAFKSNYTGDDGKYKISASIGVCFYPDDASDFKTMYKAADKALYHSKHKGKDTFTLYDKSMEE